jgi:hypothetical protein
VVLDGYQDANEEPDWVGDRFWSQEGMTDRIKILNEALCVAARNNEWPDAQ